MTNDEKQALIEHIETDLELLRNVTLKHCHEVERECVLRDIEVNEIALAALTAPPDSAPCDWVYIRFTDISKSQRMKCQIAWSDWLNSVIYDEEGAPLLISNSAFQVIRAAGYQVEGE